MYLENINQMFLKYNRIFKIANINKKKLLFNSSFNFFNSWIRCIGISILASHR